MLTLGMARSTLFYGASEVRIAVTLRRRRILCRDQDMGTCSIDCSTLLGTHRRLML